MYNSCANQGVDMVQCLREIGADVNLTDSRGWTALIETCYHRNLEILDTLISNSGSTPLHVTCGRGHPKAIFKLLQYGADSNHKNALSEKAPLLYACDAGHYDCIKFFQGSIHFQIKSPLYF